MTSQLTRASDEDYLKSIEISNSCREFYLNRLKSSETHKEKLKEYDENLKQKQHVPLVQNSPMQSAMEKLRKEVTSLMDQDLSLMKQLLTLNETIEELKFKRLNHVCKDSLKSISTELVESDSETNPPETRDFTGSKDSLQNKSHVSQSIEIKEHARSKDSVQCNFYMDGSMLSPFEKNEQTGSIDSVQNNFYMDGSMLSLDTHGLTGSENAVQNEFFMDGSMLSPFESEQSKSEILRHSNNKHHSRHSSHSYLEEKDFEESDEEFSFTKDIKSHHKIQICNDSGYEESGSDHDYTGTTL